MIASIGNKQGLNVGGVNYTTQATVPALSAPNSKQLLVHDVNVFNANAVACDLAIGARLATAAWKLYVVAGSTTDATAAIQAGTATNLTDTTNNHGVILQATEAFGLVVLNVSQAQTGSPVYSYQYWNGSTWASLNLLATPVYTGTGTVIIAFQPPVDWAQGSGGAVPSLNGTGGFCLRILATTAPTLAVLITSLNVATIWAYRNVSGKGSLRVGFRQHPFLLEGGKSIQPYFQIANALNSVEFSYQVAP